MKAVKLLFFIFLLSACENTKITDINLNAYFKNINGTAVFYNPAQNEYKIHNLALGQKRSSPCSTFKIMSSYIALSEHIITAENTLFRWNQTIYEYPVWNKNMNLAEASQTSCVWCFRSLINQIAPEKTTIYLQKYKYGNMDISDWNGVLNTNTDQADLKGFGIESSLKISPQEQTEVLARIMSEPTPAVQELKKIMQLRGMPVKIYGKTGLGVKNDMVADAWFVGFFEKNQQQIFFAVRLEDPQNIIDDYRHQASRYAKEIAVDIIQNAEIF